MKRQFAVFGHPIGHSLSPHIHRLFAEQCGDALDYQRQDVGVADFADAVLSFFAAAGSGLNITVPHKEAAYRLAVVRSARAECARSVNTLWQDAQGRLHGDTTDGAGLCADLQRLGFLTASARVLLLGAGGAARAVVEPLLAAGIARLDLCNRTPQRAYDLVQDMRHLGTLRALPVEEIDSAYDLVINATAASLHGEVMALPPVALAPTTACYDMVYSAQTTPFLAACQAQGVQRCSDGLGMLVEQAAEAYALWWGRRPQTAAVLSAVRADLRAAL